MPPSPQSPASQAEAYLRSTLSLRADSHGVAHALAVASAVGAIYDEAEFRSRGGDALGLEHDPQQVVRVAALLHDVCDHK
jgi:hypothetical protein